MILPSRWTISALVSLLLPFFKQALHFVVPCTYLHTDGAIFPSMMMDLQEFLYSIKLARSLDCIFIRHMYIAITQLQAVKPLVLLSDKVEKFHISKHVYITYIRYSRCHIHKRKKNTSLY